LNSGEPAEKKRGPPDFSTGRILHQSGIHAVKFAESAKFLAGETNSTACFLMRDRYQKSETTGVVVRIEKVGNL